LAFWNYREELSMADKLTRSYYELLRDELDYFLIQQALIDSYQKFVNQKEPYPFVEKREMKPRARIPDREYECQNAFLVLFVENSIPTEHKKYIRFFNDNKTKKQNLLRSKSLKLADNFDRNWKYLESIHFSTFLKSLLPVDYALLIQKDPATANKNRYTLSHFHVRVDWPIAAAAEDLGRQLRYISKEIYEKGDKDAELVQKKFFEYYGLPLMAGGRRTAAIVAAQYLKQVRGITTVYVGSSESRALFRYSERGIAKFVLVKLSRADLDAIAAEYRLSMRKLTKNYIVARHKKDFVCLFQVTYQWTSHARPPEDGKLREIKPDLNWLTVGEQLIIPRPNVWKYAPLPVNLIYT
jgi:hypothetical protein